ncbi:hypothetical protein [Pseudocnuella soli]|uniref:hypothetical protein n=1 Tax=Pseudocnuella soli TaxID=2502779 RepID=UPI0010445574|nr:hypothetical protein [Pseudocnuella soli]
MAKNEIERSQQQDQGVTIGTQGNNDMVIPGPATHGSHEQERGSEHQIPNQDKSSANRNRNTEQERNSD